MVERETVIHFPRCSAAHGIRLPEYGFVQGAQLKIWLSDIDSCKSMFLQNLDVALFTLIPT